MCRWFAYISATEECLLEDVLIHPPHSLAKQVNSHYLPKLLAHDPALLNDNASSNTINAETKQAIEHEISIRNRLLNIDGFGLTYYTPTLSYFNNDTSDDGLLRPVSYKSNTPPTHDMNFASLAANTSTKVLMAHIRAATSTPIVVTNNHPFVFGRWSFMHNGVVGGWEGVKRDVARCIGRREFAHTQGGTDSEFTAALFMTFLVGAEEGGKYEGKDIDEDGVDLWEKVYTVDQMQAALQKTIQTIMRIQHSVLKKEELIPSSLNLCVTDGTHLLACRFRNAVTEHPPSLYLSTKAGVTLNRKYPDTADGRAEGNARAWKQAEEHGKHVIVASEPSTYKEDADWELIGKNHWVKVDGLNGGRLTVKQMEGFDEWML